MLMTIDLNMMHPLRAHSATAAMFGVLLELNARTMIPDNSRSANEGESVEGRRVDKTSSAEASPGEESRHRKAASREAIERSSTRVRRPYTARRFWAGRPKGRSLVGG